MTGEPSLFQIRGLGFSVPGRVLLHPLDIDLAAGQVIGLVGHNGSGKSTLVKLLARCQRPDTGGVDFLGRPLRAWSGRALARRLAYMPQRIPLATGLLLQELVALGRYPWHGALGRFGPEDRRKVAEAMALADVESLADRQVETLSGGERQRAWMAMLIAQDAQCLILDEPIAALDIAHQVDMLALLRRVSRERGTSILVVLHDINMAARYCDEILALRAGWLIARGSPASLMRPDRLESIHGIAMGVAQPEPGAPLLAYVR